MKLKYEFVMTDMGDEMVAVPVGERADEFHAMIRLNSSAADILELLKEETTAEQVCKTLLEKYPDSTADEVEHIVADFLNRLTQEGVLQCP